MNVKILICLSYMYVTSDAISNWCALCTAQEAACRSLRYLTLFSVSKSYVWPSPKCVINLTDAFTKILSSHSGCARSIISCYNYREVNPKFAYTKILVSNIDLPDLF